MFGKPNEITFKKAIKLLKAKKCVLEQCRFCPMKLKRTFCEPTKKSEDELVNFTKDYINWYVSRKWIQQLKKRNGKRARF